MRQIKAISESDASDFVIKSRFESISELIEIRFRRAEISGDSFKSDLASAETRAGRRLERPTLAGSRQGGNRYQTQLSPSSGTSPSGPFAPVAAAVLEATPSSTKVLKIRTCVSPRKGEHSAISFPPFPFPQNFISPTLPQAFFKSGKTDAIIAGLQLPLTWAAAKSA